MPASPSYAYSIIFTPEFSTQVNAVIGSANDDLGLDPPGTPGQPSTYNMDPLACMNILGEQGWRFVDRLVVEPWWPDETGPPVYGLMIEKAS